MTWQGNLLVFLDTWCGLYVVRHVRLTALAGKQEC